MSWRLGLLAALLVLPGCQSGAEGSGSNTNWLRSCEQDAECAEGRSCLCNVCTTPCSQECGGSGLLCSTSGSAAHAHLCGASQTETTGLCLPGCAGDDACGSSQICLDGTCIPLTGVACPTGSTLELTSSTEELWARQGTTFSDALYVPVDYGAQPDEWSEPALPATLTARVQGADGSAPDCTVHWLSSQASGWFFPNDRANDSPSDGPIGEPGEVAGIWVAGEAPEQELTAAIVDEAGVVERASVLGRSLAHDEQPQADEPEGRSTVGPTTIYLTFPIDAEADAVQADLSPLTFPHRAYYAAISLPGLFTGLQNTSDLDAAAETVPAADRVVLMSVWNTSEAEAHLVYAADDVVCGSHTQDDGGIQCTLDDAWQLQASYRFTLELRALTEGEVPAEYAELGYDLSPCASAAGCRDMTLRFGEIDSGTPRLVAVLRHPSSAPPGYFSSFLQGYNVPDEQTSCLAAPLYEALIEARARTGDAWIDLRSGTGNASYASFRNQVCANYVVGLRGEAFHLATGGPRALGRPAFVGEPGWPVTLP